MMNQIPSNEPQQPFGAPVPTNMSSTYAANGDTADGPRLSRSDSFGKRVDSFRSWSVNTFKCTKQLLNERLGKGSKTVDTELEPEVARIRDIQQRYATLLLLAKQFTSQLASIVQTQKAMAECFAELSSRQPELGKDFSDNAETQRVLVRNTEPLIAALNFFISSLSTVVSKTIEDTLITVRKFEQARLEFDAYRSDFEMVSNSPQDASTITQREAAQLKYTEHKAKYEQLRADVQVKMKFLDENRIKVMQKQLLLLNSAIVSYFTGNQKALQDVLSRFSVKTTPQESFLEK